MCALAIITIFIAARTPRSARAIAARRAEAAARRLSADIEWLRSAAKYTSSTQLIAFSGSSYTLTGFTNPDTPGPVYRVNAADTSYKAGIASLNLGGPMTLSFNGYGVPSVGGAIVVQFGSSRRTVAIHATSRTVSWQSRLECGDSSPLPFVAEPPSAWRRAKAARS